MSFSLCPATKCFDVARAARRDGERRLLVHPDPDRPDVVLEDLRQLPRLLAARPVDPVEALGVFPGPVVDLPGFGALDLELVRLAPGLDRVEDRDLRLEMLVGQLEAVVPEEGLRRAGVLVPLPSPDPVLVAHPARELLVGDLVLSLEVGKRRRVVRHDHRVLPVLVLEEVEDPLLLHEPRGEGEVALAVLDAEVALLEGPLDLPVDGDPFHDVLEDVGDVDPLEDPALGLAGEELELRDELGPVEGEVLVAPRLPEPDADAVEVLLRGLVRELEVDGHLRTEHRVEGDLLLVLRDHLDLEAEGPRDLLGPGERLQEEDVFPDRGRDAELAVLLDVGRHRSPPRRTLRSPGL